MNKKISIEQATIMEQETDLNKIEFTHKSKFFKFYKKYLGMQEIYHKDNKILQKVYFQKPFTS